MHRLIKRIEAHHTVNWLYRGIKFCQKFKSHNNRIADFLQYRGSYESATLPEGLFITSAYDAVQTYRLISDRSSLEDGCCCEVSGNRCPVAPSMNCLYDVALLCMLLKVLENVASGSK